MISRRVATPKSTNSALEDMSDSGTAKTDNISHDDAAKNTPGNADHIYQRQTITRVVLVVVSTFMSMFLVALDKTIISTAIPQITDEFHSLPDVGWYGSGYLLTNCAFQLLFGKLYTLYSVKYVLLTSIVLFEAASAVCGAAPNSIAFIVGRAVAGVGSAGISAGTIVCLVYTVPLEKRPQLQGAFGALFGIVSVVGPIIGGAFTSNVTWRWCFYINLPVGGTAMTIIAFCLRLPDRDTTSLRWVERLQQLDILGTSILVPGVICLLLALQWGGQAYAWSNGRVIALLTLMGILLPSFVAAQILLPKTATIPPRIFKQRSVASGFWATICIGSSQNLFVYFLPIWFQSITGVPAVQSGIRLLPLMLSTVAGSIISGFTTSKVGYYTPTAIVGSCIMSIGAGLLTTFQVNTAEGMWIGYQFMYGFGMGLCFQVPNLAAQTVLPINDVPVGLALMFFGQLLGGSIFISVGENVLGNQLFQRLSGIPGFDPSLVMSGGATSLLTSLPESSREEVLAGYNHALRRVFLIGLIMTCFVVLGTATLEWRSVLKKKNPGAESKEGTEEKELEGTAEGRER